ncbi:peptide-methionine (S)-S-oxide reductase MsrA [Pleomorphomonas sp. NRK KF1]|uniref:peptide-methionine (S)-S-oxide reductase MsrA n=1 Tax=Pleomorphomonas sp. NRK KF1 TaxID=2943000 RepID=UPI0020437E91|nr:peptide-methionine (S)-S-oxide reductase MsrA [Pleomorphomonas sp. NRK KF1]MCM5554667.1 peptide-methionine (S)-S-oxide reductase MsrA [Pleomorphomonas sp. NRK KF1]
MAFFETFRKPAALPTPETALPGRTQPIATAEIHFVNGRPMKGPIPEGHAVATFALGCFWGAERLFWRLPGVYLTSVGYSGGFTENPTYEEVCSGRTGHAEAVQVVFDPDAVSYAELVRLFFESHDPTQGMRQGNDVGTQYRSAIFVHDGAQRAVAEAARDAYAKALAKAGRPAEITTTIEPAGPYYFAEDYHQQYLAKNPSGYCGLGGTGVACPMPGAGAPS